MRKESLPINYPDGAVRVRPVRMLARGHANGRRPPRSAPIGQPSADDMRFIRVRILRDIAILALVALTIIAGSAVLLGMLWRDVNVTWAEARIVEAEEAAKVEMAAIEALADQPAIVNGDVFVLTIAGIGLVLAVLCLLRPTIIVGR